MVIPTRTSDRVHANDSQSQKLEDRFRIFHNHRLRTSRFHRSYGRLVLSEGGDGKVLSPYEGVSASNDLSPRRGSIVNGEGQTSEARQLARANHVHVIASGNAASWWYNAARLKKS
jgi:hypothetical protein